MTSEIDEQPSCEDTSSPALLRTVEPVTEGAWAEETIWTLFEKAGYTIW